MVLELAVVAAVQRYIKVYSRKLKRKIFQQLIERRLGGGRQI